MRWQLASVSSLLDVLVHSCIHVPQDAFGYVPVMYFEVAPFPGSSAFNADFGEE